MIRAKIEIVGGKALYVSSFYNAKNIKWTKSWVVWLVSKTDMQS
jgi:hypothetical protein